jgi:hypothetical protein
VDCDRIMGKTEMSIKDKNFKPKMKRKKQGNILVGMLFVGKKFEWCEEKDKKGCSDGGSI